MQLGSVEIVVEDKVANNLEELCNLSINKERGYYYKHEDGRIGFLEEGQIHWYIYDCELAGFVDKGFSEHPQMAKLISTNTV